MEHLKEPVPVEVALVVEIEIETQMRISTGTFINKRTKTGKKNYDRFFFYRPAEVARDAHSHLKKTKKYTTK